MRHLFFLFLLVLAGTLAFSQQQFPIVGTWKLQSGKITRGDSTTVYNLDSVISIKIISPTHYALLQEVGIRQYSHGGAVTITPTSYTEHIKYGSALAMRGQNNTFAYVVKGNALHMKGGSNGVIFDEVWTKEE